MIMVEIFFILFLIFFVGFGIVFFVAANLNKKLIFLQNALDEFATKVEETYLKLIEIDKRGSFMADDEVGFVFTNIKNLIKELNDFYDENAENEE